MEIIEIAVKGVKKSHYVKTIIDWIKEIKDFLEEEFSQPIKIKIIEDNDVIPTVYVNGKFAFYGLLDNEGELIEIVKSILEEK